MRPDGGGGTSVQRSQSAVSERSDPTVRVPGRTQRRQRTETPPASLPALSAVLTC